MEMMMLELIGLVGVTLVITYGSIFEAMRDWTISFEHPANVIRWFGLVINCPQCSGFWVGAAWGIASHQPWLMIFVTGGLVSISTIVADFTFRITSSFVDRMSGSVQTDVVRQLLEIRAAKKRALDDAKAKQIYGEDISEDEAHDILDEQNDQADVMAG